MDQSPKKEISMMDFLNFFLNPALLKSTLVLSTPILFACLAGLFTERAGIVDIGLEGKLLLAAFASAAFAAVTGNAWLGMFMGVFVSILFSLLHGFSAITLHGNQLISGVAVNFLAVGLTGFLGKAWFQKGGNTPPLSGVARFESIELPFAASIGKIPVIGTFYQNVLSGNAIWVYVALLCVPLTAWIVYKTRFGLRLLAVGEEPAAVETAGISVKKLRYTALIISGVLVGLGGVYLSNGMLAGFGPRMSAERGYMALAALIFAKWRPWQSLWSCLLFGYFAAFAIRYGSYEFPVIGKVPSQFMDALPYILTIVVLGGFIGKAIAPKAIGVPYSKEH